MNLDQEKMTTLVLQYGFHNWFVYPCNQLDDPLSGHYNFTTDEFVQWCEEDGGQASSIPSLAEINIALKALPKCTLLVSDNDPNDLWCWRLDP